jgi:hypothetical protein
MMLYTNIKKILLHFLTLSLVSTIQAETQFDITGSVVSGKSNDDVNAVSSATKKNGTAGNANVKYFGNYTLFSKLGIILEEQFDGLMAIGQKKDSTGIVQPVSEKLVPSSNYAAAGIQSNYYGDVQLLVKNWLYLDPSIISPYYLGFMDIPDYDTSLYMFDGGVSIKRKMRTDVNLSMVLPIRMVEFTADINYFALNYQRSVEGLNLTTFELETFNKSNKTDVDLISDLGLKVNLPQDIAVAGGVFLKQNISGSAFMNLYQYKLQLQGDNRFPSDNKITWSLGVEQLMRNSSSSYPDGYGVIIQNHSFTEKPYYTMFVRDVYTLDWGFFLKGIVILDLGKDLYKQRYELSLRKAWQNESSIDFGYFNAMGGLFPMQGMFIRSIYRPIEKLGISLNTKSVWEGPDHFLKKISYLKTNVNAEVSYRYNRHSEIALGGEYLYFDPGLVVTNDFSSRFAIAASLRGWF